MKHSPCFLRWKAQVPGTQWVIKLKSDSHHYNKYYSWNDKIIHTSPDLHKTWRSACQTSSFSLSPPQSEVFGWLYAATGDLLVTWSFLKISSGTMKLSNARSSIRDRSSSIALKICVAMKFFVVVWGYLTISVSPSPLGSQQWPVHRQSERKGSARIPIKIASCVQVGILTWLEPMQSNLKLTRWSERLRCALDRFFAAPTRFFTSLISSFMFWLVLSSSFSWLCRLSLDRKFLTQCIWTSEGMELSWEIVQKLYR